MCNKALKSNNTKGLSIEVSDGDVWLNFGDVLISVETLCKFGIRGPIVRRNLRRWRDVILTEQGTP